jgi:hypothetical protein
LKEVDLPLQMDLFSDYNPFSPSASWNMEISLPGPSFPTGGKINI